MNELAVQPQNGRRIAIAEPSGVPRDGVEDGLDIGLRSADDAQDLACRRLLFQRLSQIVIPRLQLLEQAHVLNGDDRLVGEHLEKGDLLVGKSPWRRPHVDVDRADRGPVTKHGHRQHATKSGSYDCSYVVVAVLATSGM